MVKWGNMLGLAMAGLIVHHVVKKSGVTKEIKKLMKKNKKKMKGGYY